MNNNKSKYIKDWENPGIFEKNQVQPHTTLNIFESRNQALKGNMESSSCRFNLNGKWKFDWAQNPESAPEEFFEIEYDDRNWDEITVPSCWQMEGYGHPLFRNVAHSFLSNPPKVPSDFNPVGSYVKTFTLPEDWEEKKIFLHFEGVKSASYVWINGKEVGYNQGGMEPAEYDITEYLTGDRKSVV